LQEQTHKVNTETGSATTPRLEAEAEQDDINMADVDSAINDDTTLKGTIQIVADDTEYDQEKILSWAPATLLPLSVGKTVS
jgi:hypothetical protein